MAATQIVAWRFAMLPLLSAIRYLLPASMWLWIGLIVGLVIGLIIGIGIGFSLYARAGSWD